jgi:hypothetical protein
MNDVLGRSVCSKNYGSIRKWQGLRKTMKDNVTLGPITESVTSTVKCTSHNFRNLKLGYEFLS